jgi:hypothetical protein
MKNIRFKTLLVLLFILIISILWLKFSPQQKTISSEIPQCYAGRCPIYYSFTVDKDSYADESELIVPTSMTQGAGKLMIIKKGKIIFESSELMEIGVRSTGDGNGFVLTYSDQVNHEGLTKEQRYRYKNGEFAKDNGPATPNTLDADIESVQKAGFSIYNPNDPIYQTNPFIVLIGTCTGSADGYCQKAFFFYKGKFVGTDSPDTSVGIGFKWSTDKIIALNYIIYNKDDSLASPTGGAATVRFQYDGKTLKPLDQLPTNDWTKNGHR